MSLVRMESLRQELTKMMSKVRYVNRNPSMEPYVRCLNGEYLNNLQLAAEGVWVWCSQATIGETRGEVGVLRDGRHGGGGEDQMGMERGEGGRFYAVTVWWRKCRCLCTAASWI